MKKTLKIFMIALMAVMLLFVTVQPTIVLADQVTDITAGIKGSADGTKSTDLTTTAKNITSFIWVLSVVISVIVLMIIGVKYIIGGVQEKAEYKKSLIPVVVGIIVVVSATTIVNFLFGFNG